MLLTAAAPVDAEPLTLMGSNFFVEIGNLLAPGLRIGFVSKNLTFPEMQKVGSVQADAQIPADHAGQRNFERLVVRFAEDRRIPFAINRQPIDAVERDEDRKIPKPERTMVSIVD